MADFLTNKEIDTLKGEIKEKEEILGAEKYMLARQLRGELGKQIEETLNNPPRKPNKILGLKYRYARWKTIRDGKKKEKEFLKNMKEKPLQ